MKKTLEELYKGLTTTGKRFRSGVLLLDIIAISFFVLTTFIQRYPSLFYIELLLGFLFLADYIARLYISERRIAHIFKPLAIADIIVILSLFVPALAGNFAFLRVLRTLRLLRSYHVLWELKKHSKFIAINQDILFSLLNLLVFIFIVTAFVYVLQAGVNPQIKNYVDALYFTVTTLTTTGFGDITLIGTEGRLLAVLIMIFGISLFIRLGQTIFRPSKVRYECPECGLNRHESDAVHCKHCGHTLHITTSGS